MKSTSELPLIEMLVTGKKEKYLIHPIIEIFLKLWPFHMHRRKKMSRDKRGFKRVAGQLITGNKVRDLLVKEFQTSNELRVPLKFS